MDPSHTGFAGYPNAGVVQPVYTIAVEVVDDTADSSQFQWDQSASCIPKSHADPAWIAQKNGSPLPTYNQTGVVADLGNVGFQNACAQEVIGKAARWGLTAIYLDNMFGAVSVSSLNGQIPDGYADDADWRARAAIPFIANFGRQLRDAGIYLLVNAGDNAIPGSGEYQDGGDAAYRWFGQIAPYVDGLFNEYFVQRPTDNRPFSTAGGAWYANWDGWQRLVARAQSLGKDFYGLTYADTGTAQRFGRGSFLLDADLTRKSTWFTWNTADRARDVADPALTLNPGGPALGSKQQVGAVWKRVFPSFTVYVNPTTAAAVADGRTVPALDAVFATG